MDIINYEITNDIEEKIWQDAVIVFDTSSLLNIYKLTDKAKDDFIKNVIIKLNKRIWLPYYVFYEYNKNRHKPINEILGLYSELNKFCSKINENFQQIKNNTKNKDNHPIINNTILSDFEPHLDNFSKTIGEEIENKIKTIKRIFEDDVFMKSIESNIEIGEKFSFKEILDIINEGDARYQHKIPPGYKDIDKIGFQKFADLIIWKEILKYANSKSKSIIFVVDDKKEDWWVLDPNKKPIRPRDELVYEICEKSDIIFLMYTTHSFIDALKRKLKIDFLEETLEEIEFISLIDTYNNVYKGIKLSSDSGSGTNEQDRIERLINVVDYIFEKNNNLKIIKLNDHEGMLTVYWENGPSLEEKNTVEEAWESVNELKENVEHILLKNRREQWL
ncbi:MAG: PIN domain-containing protein [Bacteroidales bacterium]|nr:PIN domain-containing protein [Bacteroidales bacterium]